LTLAQRPAVDEPGGAVVEWRSDRHAQGPITLTYRVRVSAADGAAHKFQGIRSHAGGFEGTGSTFLLLPPKPETYVTRLAWDLSGAGAAAVAVSACGEGDLEISGPLDRIGGAIFMSGPRGVLSIDEGSHHL